MTSLASHNQDSARGWWCSIESRIPRNRIEEISYNCGDEKTERNAGVFEAKSTSFVTVASIAFEDSRL